MLPDEGAEVGEGTNEGIVIMSTEANVNALYYLRDVPGAARAPHEKGDPHPTRTNGQVTVTVLGGRHGELPDIRDAWQRCLGQAPDHQQLFSYEYFDAWLKYEARGGHWSGETRVLLAHDCDGEIVGILPLACKRRGLFRLWMLAGPYEPLRGFVCHPRLAAEVSEAFARKLVSMHVWLQAVRLGPVDTGFPEICLLMEHMQRLTGRLASFVTPAAVYASSVPTTVAQFQERVRASRNLSRIASRQRRFEREEGLRIERYANPTGERLSRILQECRLVESRSWLASAADGRLRFGTDEQLNFWRHLGDRDTSSRRDIDFWVVYIGGKPVAFDVVITLGTIRYLYAGQYDKDYAKYGLGWMLYMAYTQEGIERGVRTIDMGTGSVEYKQQAGGAVFDVRRDACLLPGGVFGTVAAKIVSSERGRVLLRRMRQWRQTGLTGILTAASHPQTEMVVVSASDDVVATPVLFAMLNTFFALA
jgi:CelD/BcsL family acetyltransferase involved in cellulose biosynthesis